MRKNRIYLQLKIRFFWLRFRDYFFENKLALFSVPFWSFWILVRCVQMISKAIIILKISKVGFSCLKFGINAKNNGKLIAAVIEPTDT